MKTYQKRVLNGSECKTQLCCYRERFFAGFGVEGTWSRQGAVCSGSQGTYHGWCCRSLQWDCVLVGITRLAILPHQGVAFALHCPAYLLTAWGYFHGIRTRYSSMLSPTIPTRDPMWMLRLMSRNIDSCLGANAKLTLPNDTRGPGNRRSGANGSTRRTDFSSGGISIAARFDSWKPDFCQHEGVLYHINQRGRRYLCDLSTV